MFIRKLSAILLMLLITSPAWAEPKTATDKVVDTFMQLDEDASSGVSFSEYKAMVDQQAASRFSQMDSNRDDEVSEDEYRQFWTKEKARWYRLQR